MEYYLLFFFFEKREREREVGSDVAGRRKLDVTRFVVILPRCFWPFGGRVHCRHCPAEVFGGFYIFYIYFWYVCVTTQTFLPLYPLIYHRHPSVSIVGFCVCVCFCSSPFSLSLSFSLRKSTPPPPRTQKYLYIGTCIHTY